MDINTNLSISIVQNALPTDKGEFELYLYPKR